jgi:transposase
MEPTPDTPEKSTSALAEAKKSSPKPKKEKKPVAKKKAAPKKTGLSKSDEVRKLAKELQARGEKVRPVTIVTALKARGIVVAPPQVSMVLKQAGFKSKKRRKKSAAPAAPVSKKTATAGLNVEDLIKAKKMVAEFGGAEKLVNAISALVELQ